MEATTGLDCGTVRMVGRGLSNEETLGTTLREKARERRSSEATLDAAHELAVMIAELAFGARVRARRHWNAVRRGLLAFTVFNYVKRMLFDRRLAAVWNEHPLDWRTDWQPYPAIWNNFNQW